MPTTVPDPALDARPPSLGTAMERLKHRWGWFVALGMLAAILGVVALGLAVHATITTVFIIAIFMIVAGGSQIMVGLNARTWGREILLILAGLAYIVAGAFALARPGPAAVVLTLLLGFSMLTAGIIRIWVGAHMHSHRTMVILGGGVTALVGLVIVLGWPTNSLVILGTLLGVDLLFTGLMWIGFGLRLRSHA